jgi:hypothetical protein
MQPLTVVGVRHGRRDDEFVLVLQAGQRQAAAGKLCDLEPAAVQARVGQRARGHVGERGGTTLSAEPDGGPRPEQLVAHGQVEVDVVAGNADKAGPALGLLVGERGHAPTLGDHRLPRRLLRDVRGCPGCPVACATRCRVHIPETEDRHCR